MTKIIGHRGARGLAPENTAAAIRAALKHKVDEIEIDVRVTKDNIVILHHNKTLVDSDGLELAIADHTFAMLKKHKPDLATLEEIMDLINHRVALMIEVKPNVRIEPIVGVLQSFIDKGWQPTSLAIASFSQRTLKAFHRAIPDIPRVVIERFSSAYAVYRARGVKAKRLNMNQFFLWAGSIMLLERMGYQLSPYTLNNPRKARRWKRAGLSALITDDPSLFTKDK